MAVFTIISQITVDALIFTFFWAKNRVTTFYISTLNELLILSSFHTFFNLIRSIINLTTLIYHFLYFNSAIIANSLDIFNFADDL